MGNHSNTLTIGALAQVAGVNVETIRFYQRKGLMPVPARPCGGIRRYSEADAARLGFVKSAQRLGFSLDEVAELLSLEDGEHCDEIRRLAERKLADVRGKLTDLKRMEQTLADLAHACRTRQKNVSCPLTTSLRIGAGAQNTQRKSYAQGDDKP
ncbi:Hg(II)-responsive transcriptional regulator [Methylohalobius crimeensis]|uniref:Hg(II)-responsive transcriptional regulator n=1 Tax=Methylohalobius crimeensis TaxID=244365 RepID=UPI0003B39AD2|nr:Hg(II)-responsive transcriptional regulator [Methylohalobius crimeensis]